VSPDNCRCPQGTADPMPGARAECAPAITLRVDKLADAHGDPIGQLAPIDHPLNIFEN
jgi:hypothetical protein